MARTIKPELPPSASEVERAADMELSDIEKQQVESRAFVEIAINKAKIFGINAVAGTGGTFMILCAAMLLWLLFELANHLSDEPDLLISFLIAVWETLKNGAAVSFPLLLYFTRKKDSDK